MKIIKNPFFYFIGILCWICTSQSCTHDAIMDINTGLDPIDTLVVDTMGMENPCDPEVIYFSKDILPIFISSCALSGCHDVTSASSGMILDSYVNILDSEGIEAFDLSNSDIYEAITENDIDEIMPPSGKLDNGLINLIASWILQGAENLECDEEEIPCELQNVSYNDFVSGVMQISCNGCHSSTVANGGVITDTYSNLKIIADNGRLMGAIFWEEGYQMMPQGQEQMDSCTINKIKSWIDGGAQNN